MDQRSDASCFCAPETGVNGAVKTAAALHQLRAATSPDNILTDRADLPTGQLAQGQSVAIPLLGYRPRGNIVPVQF